MILASELGASPRLVALVLSTHMNRNGGSCFPSLATLQRETRLKRQTIWRAVAELESAGLLEVDRHRGRSNRYRALGEMSTYYQVPDSPGVGAELTPRTSNRTSITTSTRAKARSKRERGRAPRARPDDEDLRVYDA